MASEPTLDYAGDKGRLAADLAKFCRLRSDADNLFADADEITLPAKTVKRLLDLAIVLLTRLGKET